MFENLINSLNGVNVLSDASFSAPFQKIASLADSVGGNGLKDIAFACAVCGLAYVAIAFTIGGTRMRQGAKGRLPWIATGVLIAVFLGGIIKWLQDAGGNSSNNPFSSNDILPMFKIGKDQIIMHLM